MSEIKINVTHLQGAIDKMNSLKSEWSANKTINPPTLGGGATVSAFEELTQMYKDLNSHMVTLATNTAAFLTNVRNSYVESDNKAASGMSGK